MLTTYRQAAKVVLAHKGENTVTTRDFTATTFVVRDNQVLLLYHAKLKMWLPPGGHIEPHELPDDAARREVREEAGINVKLVAEYEPAGFPHALARPAGVQLEDIAPGHQHIDLIYFAVPCDDAPLRESHESSGLGWYALEQLPAMGVSAEVCAWAAKAVAAGTAHKCSCNRPGLPTTPPQTVGRRGCSCFPPPAPTAS